MSTEKQNSTSMARVIYILLLVNTIIPPITGIVALIMAYVMKDGADDTMISHYRFQIRTFWIGLLYAFIGGLLIQAIVGLLILLLTFIWVVVRCAKGLRWLERYEPVTDVETWMF